MVMAELAGINVEEINAKPLSKEESLDLAEELFVSCRFTEAATVCNEALQRLTSIDTPASRDSGNNNRQTANSGPVVAFGDQLIAPVRECGIFDLIVVILLQCGFELRRAEEWSQCRRFYDTKRGAIMPFVVALLW